MPNFSESYIEMVINNKQIQDLCKYKEGDWFYFDKFDWEIMRDGDNKDWYKNNGKWLPTLEDLFGIWCNLGEATNFAGLCQRITDRKSKIIRYPNIKFMKELCLEEIMKNFYNKDWNKEKKEWEEM